MNKSNVVFLSLGSNLGDRFQFLNFAVNSLNDDQCISVGKRSSIYETTPIGVVDQANFLNMVVKIKTSYTPLQLLERTQQIQNQAGREYNVHWGPRTLDLDILLYNEETIEMEQLSIPHSRMFERGFVMIPLRELNSNMYFPSIGKSIEQVFNELSDKEGVRLWKSLFGEEE
ncbi:2-amino-4-hydroxy-6-hydroxymethyldihydropteridine diphosphokinase [Bacillaceae bacterium IKA-2]|jgi:2-amino-4-hydroxy-6-hydroxymethyldihydropteridine diphosphokinase|nr:2-amino-4-hydroxy-6-hydroxymethyldihydropteridine diphosphokinase [Bacillaceae bacterium IKA-2]